MIKVNVVRKEGPLWGILVYGKDGRSIVDRATWGVHDEGGPWWRMKPWNVEVGTLEVEKKRYEGGKKKKEKEMGRGVFIPWQMGEHLGKVRLDRVGSPFLIGKAQ
jgi:hypothetical protein